jgi:hypothetical protein
VVTIEKNPGFNTWCRQFIDPSKPQVGCVNDPWVGEHGMLDEAAVTATVLAVPYPVAYHTPPASEHWHNMTYPWQRPEAALQAQYRSAPLTP